MYQNSSYLKLKNYFQDLVEKSEFMEDFVGFFARELHNKEQSLKGIASPFLALFDYSVDIEGDQVSKGLAYRKVRFGILRNDVPSDDYEAQYQAIDDMEALAMKIASRIRFDSNKEGHFLYGAFLKDSLEVRPVELEGDGIFGVEMSLQLKNIQSLKLDATDWKDIQEVC